MNYSEEQGMPPPDKDDPTKVRGVNPLELMGVISGLFRDRKMTNAEINQRNFERYLHAAKPDMIVRERSLNVGEDGLLDTKIDLPAGVKFSHSYLEKNRGHMLGYTLTLFGLGFNMPEIDAKQQVRVVLAHSGAVLPMEMIEECDYCGPIRSHDRYVGITRQLFIGHLNDGEHDPVDITLRDLANAAEDKLAKAASKAIREKRELREPDSWDGKGKYPGAF